ncbi:putative Ig domain-containing protein, partial [Staphylococcus sp. HMSC055A09]|uniref:lectin-like domain-containing protein n=1 Tax=Staphylococcus sp. HMSC055A09 TaxID=1715121 RepID=UPI00159F65F2
MSKKERDFNKSLGQEKARVKLYKSGKNWVKASISEFELLRTMGVPFLSKNIKKESQTKDNKGSRFKKNAAKTTALVGGAFTFNMLQDHHALAASETPMTSEISSNSGTVANQNSTTIRNSQAKVTNNTTSNSTQQSSEIKNSTTKTSSSEVINKNESSSEKAVENNQNSESIKKEASESTNKAQNSEQSKSSSEKSSISKSTVSNTSSTNNDKNSQQLKNTSTSEKTSQESQQLKSTSESSNNKKEGQSTLTQHSQTATQKDTSNNQASTHTSEKPTINKNSQSASESTASKVSNLRTFSRMSVFKTLAATPAASTTTASSVSSNSVVVTKDNFNDHMNVSGSATFDKNTGIVTLTPDVNSVKGAISLNTRLDSNRSFRFTGKVNLGSRYEGHNEGTGDTAIVGGDGIGFAFSPGNLGEIGKEGAAVGIGGLKNAFGFKLDTYHNTSQPKGDAKANKDPGSMIGKGAFGAFVSTDPNGVATTDENSASPLKVQPTDNSLQDFVIDYNGDTKVMTITYAGQTWTKNMSDWIKRSGSTTFSLSMTASTGGARNLQQVQFGKFEYTQSATAQVRYVDAKTGKDIIPPKTYAGEVDGSATIDKQIDAMKSKGYNYSGVDSTGAPNYTDSTGTVKLTNAGQTIIYKFNDAQKPTISVSNPTIEVGKPTSPISVTVTDNSSDPVKTTVTGLPDGLSFDSTTNTITGTPTHIGTTTVQVHSEDSTGNASDSSFVITVKDSTGPTITQISNQSSEVYNPINPITISTTDNSGTKVVSEVSGLPDGLTFDSNTNTISGTPSKMGSFTITITSKDETGNTSTSTFKYDVTRNSTSDSISTSSSKSLSTSKSNSIANSESASTSKANSESASTSTADSESASTSKVNSESASTSKSDSESASTSKSDSESASTSKSDSESASTSTSDSQSKSTSESESNSISESKSKSTSIADSQSKSAAESTSKSISESNSQKASESTSKSASTSVSDSESANTSTSTSESYSTFISDSDSTSISDSNSTSTSTSDSISDSGSLSESTSLSNSRSASTSLSDSTSGSISASESASTSLSTSESDSTSAST